MLTNHTDKKSTVKIIASTFICASMSVNAALYSPVATDDSFYTRDIIFGSGDTLGATGITSNFGSRQFYENGIVDAAGTGTLTGGLAADGAYTVVAGADTVNFQLRGDAVNNVHVFHGGDPSKTLTFSTPGKYSGLSFLVSGAGAGNLDFTINYSTGLAQNGEITAIPNWGANASNELFNVARTTSDRSGPKTWDGNREVGENFSFFHYEFSTDDTREITSVAFTLDGGQHAMMGISGVAVPEPSSTALIGLAGLGVVLRRRR